MAGSFVLDLSRFEQKVNGKAGLMQQVVRKVAFEAFKRCIEKSPVDTGRFRANWGVMVDKPNTSTSVVATDKTGAATIAKAQTGVAGWSGQGSIFLTNNLVYSIPLEYGHSKQAPGGMVRVTVAEMQTFVQEIANGST